MRNKLSAKAILIPTISLFLICLVVTALLALTNNVTADKIAENEAQSKENSMFAVLPDAAGFDELEADVMYQGKDKDGNIVGVDVFYNDDETPGLGKNTSNDDFRSQFKGLSAKEDIVVSKDSTGGGAQTIDAVTSATISSRAVTKAVNEACDKFTEYTAKEAK